MDKNTTLCLVKLTLAQRDALRDAIAALERDWDSDHPLMDVARLEILVTADVQLEFAEVLPGRHE